MSTTTTIRLLQSKVQTLQNQLSQRTRNFLLRKGLNQTILAPVKVDQYAQTDMNYSEMESNPSQNQGLSSAYDSYYSSHLKQDNTVLSRINISEFLFNQNQEMSQNRQKISQIIQELREIHKTSQQQNIQTKIDDNDSILENNPQAFSRQRRRLKREIKKLSQRLAFQQRICQIAKEGLLISQEENYQFRLKIMQLMKNRQYQNFQAQMDDHIDRSCQIEALKSQIMNLEKNLSHQKQLNRQHLQSSLQILEEINQLFQENGSLKKIINHFRQRQESHSETKSEDHSYEQKKINLEILEEIKSIAFSISNCIPVINQQQNVSYFRPQTIEEVLNVLKRVQQYCKQIQKWQIQRIQSMARQKRLFSNVLSKISGHIDKQTKKKLHQQLIKIQNMSHFSSIFTLRQSMASQIYLQTLQDHVSQVYKVIKA